MDRPENVALNFDMRSMRDGKSVAIMIAVHVTSNGPSDHQVAPVISDSSFPSVLPPETNHVRRGSKAPPGSVGFKDMGPTGSADLRQSRRYLAAVIQLARAAFAVLATLAPLGMSTVRRIAYG